MSGPRHDSDMEAMLAMRAMFAASAERAVHRAVESMAGDVIGPMVEAQLERSIAEAVSIEQIEGRVRKLRQEVEEIAAMVSGGMRPAPDDPIPWH